MMEGRRLKRLMRGRGLSLSKMGARMGGVPITTVHQWTKCDRNNAHIDTLIRICHALDDVCLFRLLSPEILREQEDDLRRILQERGRRSRRRKASAA